MDNNSIYNVKKQVNNGLTSSKHKRFRQNNSLLNNMLIIKNNDWSTKRNLLT